MRLCSGSTVLLLALSFLLSLTAGAEEPRLAEGIARLEPWLGTWQIEATWAGGATLWSQAEYRPMLDGAFIEAAVYVRDNGGELYQRYQSILAAGETTDQVAAHSLSPNGYSASTLELEGSGVGMVMTTSWNYDTAKVKERLEHSDADTWHWQVWTQAEGSEAWEQIMDGEWHRVDAAPIELPRTNDLHESVAALRPFLGGWEAAIPNRDGSTGWVRNESRAGLGGRFVEVNSWELAGDSYQRSVSFFFPATESAPAGSVSFLQNGGVVTASVTIGGDPVQIERLIRAGVFGEREFLQTIRLESPERFQMSLANRLPGEEEWLQVRQSTWYRQGSAPGATAYPIPAGRFAASGSELRSFVKEVEIDAPVETVYAAWTTADGWARVYGPPSRADIELAVGGRYEWLFDGSIGGNGSQVLSYIPNRMVSFSWNAPPSQPEARLSKTWVVVELEPLADGGTHVRLSHLGFGEGPIWDTTYAYFDKAWNSVLNRMQSSLASEQ